MLLSNRFRNFKKKNSQTYNFSCPICGDSDTNKRKARGYLFERKGTFRYHCHNCSTPINSFEKLLKVVDPDLYREYSFEKYKEANNFPLEVKKLPVEKSIYDRTIFKDLKRISDLNADHYAKQYVLNRKIPGKYHKDLYYCPKFVSFVNQVLPKKELKGSDNARLIIPFGWKGKLSAFLGRTLVNDNLRYSMIVLDNDVPHIFNIESVDTNRKYYVVEGPLDSMFLENCIAVSGSELTLGVYQANINKDNAVLIYDNQPRNPEIIKKINQAIENGFSVVLWPFELESKDINDMVKDGYTPSEVQHLIDSHTYQGLQAKLQFIQWKRTNNV
jgi:hypothetical protein